MSAAEIAIVVLVAVIVYQNWFYTRQIQTLVDKLMCRSYTEYTKATAPPVVRIPAEGEPPEDLRPLQEFQF